MLVFILVPRSLGRLIGGESTEKEVALTFDDGPNDPFTLEILDALAGFGIKATFFEIGKKIELYPWISSRIVREGHVLGNHSYSHSLSSLVTHPSYKKELQQTQEIIKKITGVTPALFRPPHLFREPLMTKTLEQNHLYLITGTYGVTKESFSPPAFKMAKEILKKIKPGEIIILHDGFNCPKQPGP